MAKKQKKPGFDVECGLILLIMAFLFGYFISNFGSIFKVIEGALIAGGLLILFVCLVNYITGREK